MKNIFRIALAIVVSSFSIAAFAWDHSLEIGYGYSHDPNHSHYKNDGYLLSSDIYPIHRNNWSFWSLTGSLGQWHTTTPTHQHLTTVAASIAVRLYPFQMKTPPYILGSVGPAYMSARQFGYNKQGSNVAFQINGGVGIELKPLDVNLRFVHFSNAHLANPDHGFNILYLLSFGYLFG